MVRKNNKLPVIVLVCIVAGLLSSLPHPISALAPDKPTLITDKTLFHSSGSPHPEHASQPVIGVLTQPWRKDGGSEYVPSGYVKFIEQAGARVVAIQFSLPDDELRRRLGEIHGILLPGGGNDLTPGASRFMLAAAVVWEHALQANERGEEFSVFGTCQGWEMLAVLTSSAGEAILDKSGAFNSELMGCPLEFTDYAREESEMFSELSVTLLDALANEPLTVNAHTKGVTPEVVEQHSDLNNTWRILATSVDQDGKRFVTAVEAKHLKGVFATQFHPEKAQFNWPHQGAIERSHTEEGALLGQHLANVFVRHARKRAIEKPATEVVDAWEIDLIGRRKNMGDKAYFAAIYLFDTYVKPTVASKMLRSGEGQD